MPNIAMVLKDEIRRLAKSEIKANISSTKQAVAQYRRDIAKLKRLIQGQQKEIAFLKAQERKRLGQPAAKDNGELEGVRHSARSVRAQRRRLGLSREDFGKLVGVSPLTVYYWELGKARPTKARLATLVSVRKMGKREARKKVELLA
jgi:DNA-binding transcriptional regulator YiaG